MEQGGCPPGVVRRRVSLLIRHADKPLLTGISWRYRNQCGKRLWATVDPIDDAYIDDSQEEAESTQPRTCASAVPDKRMPVRGPAFTQFPLATSNTTNSVMPSTCVNWRRPHGPSWRTHAFMLRIPPKRWSRTVAAFAVWSVIRAVCSSGVHAGRSRQPRIRRSLVDHVAHVISGVDAP